MKLIKKQTLYLQSGRTDNVYQVEMFDVGPQSYVVNFRYGRRGTHLKEGTRTTVPVNHEKAEKIFVDLIATQETKGYSCTPTEPSASTPEQQRADSVNPMHQAILSRLKAGADAESPWKLSRAVWRAGEIGLMDAEPILLNLLDKSRGRLTYSIVWALGRLRSRSALDRLRGLLSNTNTPNRIRRIARTAVYAMLTDDERQAEDRQTLSLLPPAIRQPIEAGDETTLLEALDPMLRERTPQGFSAFEHLYFLSALAARNAMLHALATVPMEAGYFQPIKHLFKAAEMCRDETVYGCVARRFETSPAAFSGRNYTRNNRSQTPQAFGSLTRQYLIKRVWRNLRRLGDIGHPDYTTMASGVLLAFSDEDAHPARTGSSYVWSKERGYERVDIHYDIYSRYIVFGHILYKNSPRYTFDGRRFACKPPYKPGQPLPNTREEAYPDLWTADPDALLGLLKKSRCAPVHHFAEKAIRQCDAYLQTIDGADIAALLHAGYDMTAALGFDLALARYDMSAPDLMVIAAAANCRIDAARERAHTWIERHFAAIMKETDLLVEIIASAYSDTRGHIAKQLRSALIDDTDAKTIIGRLFAFLMALKESENERAGHIAEVMIDCFSKYLTTIDETVFQDLMASPLTELHRLAGALAAIHIHLANNPPPKMLSALLASSDSRVREMGVRLIGQLPDHLLMSNRDALMAMICHEQKDIRDTIRPIVNRVAFTNTMFAKQLVHEMISALLTPKMPKGVPSHLLQVLKEDFTGQLKEIPPDQVWRLLKSRSPMAQDLGGVLLATNIDAGTLSMAQIVSLANHEILSIREASWQACRADMSRVQNNMAQAVRLLDARFEDTRQTAMPIIKAAFDAMTPDPDLLVSLCDSVRPEIQQFAKEMITRYFKSDFGETYLKKLSEHPSIDLQLFATNYLASYASDNHEILFGLMPYFQTVLSQVNRARVAKDRVLRFLAVEANKNRDTAALVADLLARQSVTVAIRDKATLIEAMMAIKRTFPDIEMPVIKRETQVRRGV